jgi:hypothetical protein
VDQVILTFENPVSDVVDDFIARTSLGTVWLDLGVPAAFPDHQWPVRLVEERIDEDFTRPMWYAIGSLPLMEIV